MTQTVTRRFSGMEACMGSLIASLLLSSLCPAQSTPKLRYSLGNRTQVWCGPAEEFYVTSHLKLGTAVEVFHQTKNGWSAIRPPEGSYCWLAAENAYLLPGGEVAEVVGQKVPAWIGSSVSTPKQFKWQIELQPSQQVRVLGESKQKIDATQERLWYRIAPPQGEFRWVRTETLSDKAPIADPNDPPILNESVASRASQESEVRLASASSQGSGDVIQAIAEVATREPLGQSPSPPSKTIEKSKPNTKGNSMNGTGKPKTAPNQQRPKSSLQETLQSSASKILGDRKSLLAKNHPVQTAQHAEPITANPVIVHEQVEPYRLEEGEYVVGSEEVVSDRVVGESADGDVPMSHSGAILEEEGEVLEGEVIGGGHSRYHLSHADDPALNDWNALNSHPGRVLVRPLNGILGWIGFGIAESEIIQPSHSSSHIVTPTQVVEPVLSSRLDSLPRPTRRSRSHPFQGMLRSSEESVGYGSEGMMQGTYGTGSKAGAGSTYGRSLLAPSTDSAESSYPSTSRNGIAPSYSSSTSDSWHARPRPMDTTLSGDVRSYVSSASMQAASPDALEPMQLSTPQLREVLFELTRIVAMPTDQWDFRQVHQYTNDWIERGSTAIERGEARLLMERIQQFETHRMRMNGNSIANLSTPSGLTNAEYRSFSPSSMGASQASYSRPNDAMGTEEASLATAHQADASGILSRVFTSRPGQPEYALTDASRSVIAYVVPQPGMNLGRYVDQPVAVYGAKGYLPELASKQIVVERVVRLR